MKRTALILFSALLVSLCACINKTVSEISYINPYEYNISVNGTSSIGNYDGTISSWSINPNSFTTGRYGHASVVNGGYLYVIGGINSSTRSAEVQFAQVNTDGSVGPWSATTPFTTARYGHSSVVNNDYLYVIGGDITGGTQTDNVQFAHLNSDGTITAASWNNTASLQTACFGHKSVVNNGYIYVTGGDHGGALDTVQYAPINTNGTLSGWGTTTQLPKAISGHGLAVYNGYLYITGGNTGSSIINEVHYAPINSANGTIGTWKSTTPFLPARAGHTCVAVNGYLYIIGGCPPGYPSVFSSEVIYAPINTDGSIGSWNATNSFNAERANHSSVVYNGYLYVIGGTKDGTYYDDVQYAQFTSN